jgi:hypothetical protein
VRHVACSLQHIACSLQHVACSLRRLRPPASARAAAPSRTLTRCGG